MSQYPRFWTYIIANWHHSTLYTGMTNNLAHRLIEHWYGYGGRFTTKHHCCHLLWYEETRYVNNAIAREKEIKSWTREKKVQLIESCNPTWKHFNEDILGNWPPAEQQIQDMLDWRKHEDEIIRRKSLP